VSTTAKNLAGRRRPKLKVLWPDEPPIAHPIAVCGGDDPLKNTVILGEILTFAEVAKLPPGWLTHEMILIPGIGFIRGKFHLGGLVEGSPQHEEYRDISDLRIAERQLRYPTDD
jgi:hypothetical protein